MIRLCSWSGLWPRRVRVIDEVRLTEIGTSTLGLGGQVLRAHYKLRWLWLAWEVSILR